MKKFSILFVFVAGVLSLTSCLKDDSDIPSTSVVTLTNLYPTESGVLYLVNNNQIQIQSGKYKSNEGFLAIPGNKNIKVIDRSKLTKEGSNANEVMIDTNLTFIDTLSYSCYVYGQVEKPKFVRAKNIAVKDLGTKSGVRVFHLASGASKINISIGDQVIPAFQNKVQESATTIETTEVFRAVNSGTFTIKATDEAGNLLAQKENVNLKSGSYHNIRINGIKGNEKFPLEISLSDQD